MKQRNSTGVLYSDADSFQDTGLIEEPNGDKATEAEQHHPIRNRLRCIRLTPRTAMVVSHFDIAAWGVVLNGSMQQLPDDSHIEVGNAYAGRAER
jgi:hypothetical protein